MWAMKLHFFPVCVLYIFSVFLSTSPLGQKQCVLLVACGQEPVLPTAWLIPAKLCNASLPPPFPRRDSGLSLPSFAQMLIFMRPEVSSVCLYHLPKCPVKLKWCHRLKFIAMTNNHCGHKVSFLQGDKDKNPTSATSPSSYKCEQILCSS